MPNSATGWRSFSTAVHAASASKVHRHRRPRCAVVLRPGSITATDIEQAASLGTVRSRNRFPEELNSRFRLARSALRAAHADVNLSNLLSCRAKSRRRWIPGGASPCLPSTDNEVRRRRVAQRQHRSGALRPRPVRAAARTGSSQCRPDPRGIVPELPAWLAVRPPGPVPRAGPVADCRLRRCRSRKIQPPSPKPPDVMPEEFRNSPDISSTSSPQGPPDRRFQFAGAPRRSDPAVPPTRGWSSSRTSSRATSALQPRRHQPEVRARRRQ